jgi:hypothetical protein
MTLSFALALFKADQIDFVIEPELHDRFHKALGHLCNCFGRGEAMPQIPAHKACDTRLSGQLGHVSIQIHPVNALQFHNDMFALEFGDTFA